MNEKFIMKNFNELDEIDSMLVMMMLQKFKWKYRKSYMGTKKI
jgi:hypothetical protein